MYASEEFHTCLEPGCFLPAEIVERFTLPSTDGPVEHYKTVCANGHVLTPLAEMLPLAPALVRTATADDRRL